LQGRSLGYGLTLLYTYVVETFIGTKSWKNHTEEDAEEEDDDGYYAFKRTRNLRPKEIQALEDLMKAEEEVSSMKR